MFIKRLAAIPPALTGGMGGLLYPSEPMRIDGLIASVFPQDISLGGAGGPTGVIDIDLQTLLSGRCCGYRVFVTVGVVDANPYTYTWLNVNNGGLRRVFHQMMFGAGIVRTAILEDRGTLIDRLQLYIQPPGGEFTADTVVVQLFGF